MKIVFIGAGNLATQLSQTLQKKGYEIIMIYSYTKESASLLGNKLNVPYTNDLNEIPVNADLYIFSVKDSVLESVIKSIKPNNGIWAHTAGSVNIDIFRHYTKRGAVFYPLQTFSKTKAVDFNSIPIFIETFNSIDNQILTEIANRISEKVQYATSEQRKYIHLSAVFACNFTNLLYDISSKILTENNLSFDILKPLINETINKLSNMSPSQAQTGPAVRYDKNVIDMQTEMINDDDLKKLYLLMSKLIFEYSNKNKNGSNQL